MLPALALPLFTFHLNPLGLVGSTTKSSRRYSIGGSGFALLRFCLSSVSVVISRKEPLVDDPDFSGTSGKLFCVEHRSSSMRWRYGWRNLASIRGESSGWLFL
jgi:hypothetical protein